MKIVFADSSYWIAIANPLDQWSIAAEDAIEALGEVRLLTTEEVLTEFLDYFSGYGEALRRQAVELVRRILIAKEVTVLAQSHESFSAGLELYEMRHDKAYSHTDCVSMIAMEREMIDEVLSADRHFRQEGFRVLMR